MLRLVRMQRLDVASITLTLPTLIGHQLSRTARPFELHTNCWANLQVGFSASDLTGSTRVQLASTDAR